MNTRKHPLGLWLCSFLFFGLALLQPAQAQVYNRFGPVDGILVGNDSTYQTTAADAADVISLWSGTCDSSTFLRGDGSCAAAGGAFPILAPNGTGAAPSYSFSNDDATGMYLGTPGELLFSVSGVDALFLDTSELYTDLDLEVAGSVSADGGLFSDSLGSNNGSPLTLSATGIAQSVDIQTNATSRLTIGGDGAWTLGADGVGSAGHVLTSAGAGGPPTWEPAGGTPGGSTTQVQYNNAGAFAGDAGLTYNAGTDALSVGTLTAATAATVGGQNVCLANGTNCPAAGGTTLPNRNFTASDNTLSTDCGKMLYFTGAVASQTFTLDADPAVTCVLTIVNNGSQNISVAGSVSLTWFAGAGSTATGTRTLTPGGVLTATVPASGGAWWVWGAGIN